MELVGGCRNKGEVAEIKKLVAEFSLLRLSPATSAEAYDLMLLFNRSHGLTIPDALIAATAIVNKLELASDNVRHFAMLPDLRLERLY